MRRLGVLLALLAVLFGFSGCGGGHDDATVTPLDDALGYVSKDAPFVAAIETDPNGQQIKQLRAIAGRFPGADLLAGRLQQLTRFQVARWDRDVRPQLGAPLVVGLLRPAAGAGLSTPLVIAMRVKHPLRAKQTLLREPGFRGGSKSSGVRIYDNPSGHRYVAVDGDTVVAATNREILQQALALKRTDNRMRERVFNHDLTGLPGGGLVRISADPRDMLGADPRIRPALTVPWIAGLRRLGAVAKVDSSGVTFDFHAATDRREVKQSDLPLAISATSRPLIGRRGELQITLAEPSRLARFGLAVAKAIAPSHMALLRAAEPSGVDLERQLPHHLNKLLQLSIDPLTRAFALRADLNQSGDVRTGLAQLAPALPAVAALFGVRGVGLATPVAGENFYALAKPNAKTTVFGVVGDSLVVSSEARRAADLSSEPTHSAPGSPKGAAVITLNSRELAGKLLARELGGAAGLLAPLAVASLRDLTGTLTNDRNGLDGHFKLTVAK